MTPREAKLSLLSKEREFFPPRRSLLPKDILPMTEGELILREKGIPGEPSTYGIYNALNALGITTEHFTWRGLLDGTLEFIFIGKNDIKLLAEKAGLPLDIDRYFSNGHSLS